MPPDHSLLEFLPMDLERHADVCVRFREDTTLCGFGSTERFHEADGLGAVRYLEWLRQRQHDLPGSLIHVWLNGNIVGQIEMCRLLRQPPIGYVNLFYLVPQLRGQGLGDALEAYARRFLSDQGCRALRLSASPTNLPAWRFNLRNGWQDLGPREDDASVHLLHKNLATEVQN